MTGNLACRREKTENEAVQENGHSNTTSQGPTINTHSKLLNNSQPCLESVPFSSDKWRGIPLPQ
jgi:hypothetical protein